MGKKREARPLISISVKVDPEVAEEIYRVADAHFKGNVSEAVREGIRLLVEGHRG